MGKIFRENIGKNFTDFRKNLRKMLKDEDNFIKKIFEKL